MTTVAAIFAAIAAYMSVFVAYQQSQTNRARLKFELYDRRLRVFGALKAALGVEDALNHVQKMDIYDAYIESHFLFKDDITQLISDVLMLQSEGESYQKAIRDGDTSRDYKKLTGRVLTDLDDIDMKLNNLFQDYMNIEEPTRFPVAKWLKLSSV